MADCDWTFAREPPLARDIAMSTSTVTESNKIALPWSTEIAYAWKRMETWSS
jgi:hypothetical protein